MDRFVFNNALAQSGSGASSLVNKFDTATAVNATGFPVIALQIGNLSPQSTQLARLNTSLQAGAGNDALKITHDSANNGSIGLCVSQLFGLPGSMPLEYDVEYELSFKFKSVNESPTGGYLQGVGAANLLIQSSINGVTSDTWLVNSSTRWTVPKIGFKFTKRIETGGRVHVGTELKYWSGLGYNKNESRVSANAITAFVISFNRHSGDYSSLTGGVLLDDLTISRKEDAATIMRLLNIKEPSLTNFNPGDTTVPAQVPLDNYFVSPSGSDDNTGAEASPFRTLEHALLTVKNNQVPDKDMSIILREGYYFPQATICIDESANLGNGKKLTIKGKENENVVISGGIRVNNNNWSTVLLNGANTYKASVSEIGSARQFYVGHSQRKLAASDILYNYAGGVGMDYDKIRLLDAPAPVNFKQLEMVWHVEWRTFMYRPVSRDASVLSLFYMPQGYADLESHRQPFPGMAYFVPHPDRDKIKLYNDLSLLDESGEFCFDESNRVLYYRPFPGENPSQLNCFVPNLDTVLKIEGNSVKVSNVSIENITFAHCNQNFLATDGLAIMQANNRYAGPFNVVERKGAPTDTMKSAVEVKNTERVSFIKCKFINTAGAGLRYFSGTNGNTVAGCIFQNLGDSAIIVGNHNGHINETRKADRDKMPRDTVITNNVVRNTGTVNASAPAITIYQTKSTSVVHNDIYYASYSGISMGWGWGFAAPGSRNEGGEISCNKIGAVLRVLKDGGGIYTLDKQAEQAEDRVLYLKVSGNYIFDINKSMASGIYHDEGSRYINTTGNLIETINSAPFWLIINDLRTDFEAAYRTGDIIAEDNITVKDDTTGSAKYRNWGERVEGVSTTGIFQGSVQFSDNNLVGTRNRLVPPTPIDDDAEKIKKNSGLEADFLYLLR